MLGRKILSSVMCACAISLFSPFAVAGISVVDGDFQSILESKSDSLTVWRVTENQDIFIFDFPSLTMQGRTFNRATQFTEHQFGDAPYPQVLNNEALQKYMDAIRRNTANFAFGHDFLVHELVMFFNLIDTNKIEIFPEEIAIRNFLLQEGLMKEWRGFYQAVKPDSVVISIPQKQPRKSGEQPITALARYTVFSHEVAHGEYYTNKYYRNYCVNFWKNLSEKEKTVFKNFFKAYNYKIDKDELLVNEMQAYLMFTPDRNSFSAAKLGVTDEELESMRRKFKNGKPPTKLSMTW